MNIDSWYVMMSAFPQIQPSQFFIQISRLKLQIISLEHEKIGIQPLPTETLNNSVAEDLLITSNHYYWGVIIQLWLLNPPVGVLFNVWNRGV